MPRTPMSLRVVGAAGIVPRAGNSIFG
jgi:hypothetical protein